MGCESHKAFIFRPLTNNNLYAHIISNRIILQPRYFHASTPTVGTNKGGIGKDSVMIRNFVLAMKNKWGRYYDYNFKKGQAKININR